MRTVTVTAGETIQLGYQYDNEATQVIFPDTIVEAITDVYGTTGTFAIWYRRSGDATGYPIGSPLITYSNDEVTWLLTEADMANPGQCQIQLRYIVDEVCVMSQIFNGIVSDSVDIGTDVPEPMEAWADAIIEAIDGMVAAGISPAIKDALLDCFEHVAWIDEHGQDYVDALEAALYPPKQLVSITAVYTQSGTVYDTDSLDSLKSDLVVTALWSDSSTSTVPAADYTLSGTLTVGTSTVTVSYGGKTDTFSVTVTYAEYPKTINYDSDGVAWGSPDVRYPTTTPPYGAQTGSHNRIRLMGSASSDGYHVEKGHTYKVTLNNRVSEQYGWTIVNEIGQANITAGTAIDASNTQEQGWSNPTNKAFTFTPDVINGSDPALVWIYFRKDLVNGTWENLSDADIFPITIEDLGVQ